MFPYIFYPTFSINVIYKCYKIIDKSTGYLSIKFYLFFFFFINDCVYINYALAFQNECRIRKALENRTNMEDDKVALLENQLAQAKLIAEEADKKYEEV